MYKNAATLFLHSHIKGHFLAIDDGGVEWIGLILYDPALVNDRVNT